VWLLTIMVSRVFHRVSRVHRGAVRHDKLTDVHRLFFVLLLTRMRFFLAFLFSVERSHDGNIALSWRMCIIVDAFAWFRWVGHVVPADFFLLR
jgi:hypothetical protein